MVSVLIMGLTIGALILLVGILLGWVLRGKLNEK